MQQRDTTISKEKQTIRHIQIITQNLFDETAQYPQSTTNRRTPQLAYHSSKSPKNLTPTHRKTFCLTLIRLHDSREKVNLNKQWVGQFWSAPRESPVAQQTIPITQTINKSIYGKFRQQKQKEREHEESRMSRTLDREQAWSNFLQRQKNWNERKMQKQLALKASQVYSHQPKINKPRHSHHDKPQKLPQKRVQSALVELRAQTEQLKKRLLGFQREMNEKAGTPKDNARQQMDRQGEKGAVDK